MSKIADSITQSSKRKPKTDFDNESILRRIRAARPLSPHSWLKEHEGMTGRQASDWLYLRRKARELPLMGEPWSIKLSPEALDDEPIPILELLDKAELSRTEAIDLCFSQAEQNKKFQKKFDAYENMIELEIYDDVFMLGLNGDDHNASQATDHELNRQLYRLIATEPGLYWGQLGDLTDMLFPGDLYTLGEQVLTMQTQAILTYLLLAELADCGKVLFRIQSQHTQHDSFGRNKTGVDIQNLQRAYDKFHDRKVIPTLKNKGWIHLKTHEDREFKIYAAHDRKGHSLYHDLQGAFRASREEAKDADILVNAHTHGPAQYWGYGDNGKPVFFAKSGTAKRERGDSYIDTGWSAGVFGPVCLIFDKRYPLPFTPFSFGQALDLFRMLKKQHEVLNSNKKP